MDFTKLNKEEIEDLIIEKATLDVLYRLDVFLERQKSKLFTDLIPETRQDRRAVLKSDLSWTENMAALCKKRQDDVRENNDRFNYRFRINAEEILPKDVYNKIAAQAQYRRL